MQVLVLFGSAHACDSEGWGFIPVCSRPTNGERLRSSQVSAADENYNGYEVTGTAQCSEIDRIIISCCAAFLIPT